MIVELFFLHLSLALLVIEVGSVMVGFDLLLKTSGILAIILISLSIGIMIYRWNKK